MKLLNWSYWKRNQIRAWFDISSHSPVLFRRVENYYFIFCVQPPSSCTWAEMTLSKWNFSLTGSLGLSKTRLSRKAQAPIKDEPQLKPATSCGKRRGQHIPVQVRPA
jgi:hypothetical protein